MHSVSEVVEWCSAYCKGNPAEHRVSFVIEDEPYTLNVCDYCLEEVIEYGPPKGNDAQ